MLGCFERRKDEGPGLGQSMARPTTRGDIIAVLNGLVREHAIASFETDRLDESNEVAPSFVIATFHDQADPEPTLRHVYASLAPIGSTIRVLLSTRPVDGTSWNGVSRGRFA